MKAKILAIVLGVVALASLPIVASAAPIEQVDVLGINGQASVSNTNINFGVAPTGTTTYVAPPGYGTFEVSMVVPGSIFATNGVLATFPAETGMIQSLSSGTFPPTAAFMTFNGGGSNLQLFATSIAPGGTPGGSCQLSPGGVFLLCDSVVGGMPQATATVDIAGNIHGDVTNPGATETFSSVLQATFSGQTVASLLNALPQAAPFSGTFSVTINSTPIVPEPMTFFLMGIGLVGAGLAVRRNKVRG